MFGYLVQCGMTGIQSGFELGGRNVFPIVLVVNVVFQRVYKEFSVFNSPILSRHLRISSGWQRCDLYICCASFVRRHMCTPPVP
jgi:hypothetical protein